MANIIEVTKCKLDVNVQDYQGHTPLHEVVANKKELNSFSYQPESSQMVEEDLYNLKLLMKFHPDLNALTSNGDNLLHLAIKNGRSIKIVEFITQLLSDNGVDINLVNKKGHTALHYALLPISFNTNLITFKQYSDFQFRFIDAAVFQHLVAKGADIDKVYRNGYSPLLMAVVMRQTEYVRIILDNIEKFLIGGLEQTSSTFLYQGIHLVCGQEKTFTYPPKEYYGMTALLIAVYDNNKEMVQMLIKAGANVNANVNAPNSNRDNALHIITKGDTSPESKAQGWNATAEQTQIAKLLIDSGIDLNAKDESGATALQLAIRHRKQDIVTHILEKGLATL